MRYNIFRARDRFQENHSTLKLIQTSVFERKKKDFHRISIPPFFFPIFILLNANTFRNTYMCVFCFKFRFPVMLECNIRTQTERGFLVWFEYESFSFFPSSESSLKNSDVADMDRFVFIFSHVQYRVQNQYWNVSLYCKYVHGKYNLCFKYLKLPNRK